MKNATARKVHLFIHHHYPNIPGSKINVQTLFTMHYKEDTYLKNYTVWVYRPAERETVPPLLVGIGAKNWHDVLKELEGWQAQAHLKQLDEVWAEVLKERNKEA